MLPERRPVSEVVGTALAAWFANTSKGWNAAMRAVLDAVLPAADAELLAIAKRRRCGSCTGYGWVPNPDAEYSMDYVDHMPTGVYSTNDEEEVECPECRGVGFLKPRPPAPPVQFVPVNLDEELPF